MTEYAVLLPADEGAWQRASAEEKSRMYAKHAEFAEILADRGHKMTGGAELTSSDSGHIVTGSLDDVTVTAGPYAESVEQLTGFYLIESDDLDDLLKCAGKLTDGQGRLEVRKCLPSSAGTA